MSAFADPLTCALIVFVFAAVSSTKSRVTPFLPCAACAGVASCGKERASAGYGPIHRRGERRPMTLASLSGGSLRRRRLPRRAGWAAGCAGQQNPAGAPASAAWQQSVASISGRSQGVRPVVRLDPGAERGAGWGGGRGEGGCQAGRGGARHEELAGHLAAQWAAARRRRWHPIGAKEAVRVLHGG